MLNNQPMQGLGAQLSAADRGQPRPAQAQNPGFGAQTGALPQQANPRALEALQAARGRMGAPQETAGQGMPQGQQPGMPGALPAQAAPQAAQSMQQRFQGLMSRLPEQSPLRARLMAMFQNQNPTG